MKENEEVESMISKITDEIQTVKNHVLEAKYSLSTDKYSEALHHLKEAEKASNCSYCQQKLKEQIFSIEYNKNICDIHSKQCIPNKEDILKSIDEFYNKLPNVEEIRKQKAINKESSSNYDPAVATWQAINTMGQSIQGMFGNLFKWQ